MSEARPKDGEAGRRPLASLFSFDNGIFFGQPSTYEFFISRAVAGAKMWFGDEQELGQLVRVPPNEISVTPLQMPALGQIVWTTCSSVDLMDYESTLKVSVDHTTAAGTKFCNVTLVFCQATWGKTKADSQPSPSDTIVTSVFSLRGSDLLSSGFVCASMLPKLIEQTEGLRAVQPSVVEFSATWNPQKLKAGKRYFVKRWLGEDSIRYAAVAEEHSPDEVLVFARSVLDTNKAEARFRSERLPTPVEWAHSLDARIEHLYELNQLPVEVSVGVPEAYTDRLWISKLLSLIDTACIPVYRLLLANLLRKGQQEIAVAFLRSSSLSIYSWPAPGQVLRCKSWIASVGSSSFRIVTRFYNADLSVLYCEGHLDKVSMTNGAKRVYFDKDWALARFAQSPRYAAPSNPARTQALCSFEYRPALRISDIDFNVHLSTSCFPLIAHDARESAGISGSGWTHEAKMYATRPVVRYGQDHMAEIKLDADLIIVASYLGKGVFFYDFTVNQRVCATVWMLVANSDIALAIPDERIQSVDAVLWGDAAALSTSFRASRL